MIEGIISLDKGIFLYLNSLGSKSYDVFWLIITNKFFNILVYFMILFKFKMKYGAIKTLHLFLFTLILIGIVDQTTNFSKFFFGRLRPCHDEQISLLSRLVASNCGGKYSFFSAHASNSFAIATFFSFIFKNLRYVGNLILFLATLIAYSRIYVGVHFPMDVLIGASVGTIISKIYIYFTSKYFKNSIFNY